MLELWSIKRKKNYKVHNTVLDCMYQRFRQLQYQRSKYTLIQIVYVFNSIVRINNLNFFLNFVTCIIVYYSQS